jgi:hypothetical protein
MLKNSDDILVYSTKNFVFFISQNIINTGVIFIRSINGDLIEFKQINNTNYEVMNVPGIFSEIKASIVADGLMYEKTLKVNH